MLNPNEPATRRQLWALHVLLKKDTREWTLTKEQASQMIDEASKAKGNGNGHKDSLVKPGDYFYTSWGYDQTNIDYVVVSRVSPSGKTAHCQCASAVMLGASGTSDVLTPANGHGPEFPMKVKLGYQGGVVLRGSYPFCGSNDNYHGKRLDTFSPTTIGDTHHQTNPMFGH